ncbi:hypothetical protein E4U10_007260, partial [Claviceps purpurea]
MAGDDSLFEWNKIKWERKAEAAMQMQMQMQMQMPGTRWPSRRPKTAGKRERRGGGWTNGRMIEMMEKGRL